MRRQPAASHMECELHRKELEVAASLPEHSYSQNANGCRAVAGAECTGVALHLKMHPPCELPKYAEKIVRAYNAEQP